MIQELTQPREIIYWKLNRNWLYYQSCLQQCWNQPKSKPVHEMRTTLRRLVATVDLLKDCLPELGYQSLKNQLKKGLKITSQLRDFQYQEKNLEDCRGVLLEDFQSELVKARKKEQRRVKKQLRQINLKKQNSAVQSLVHALMDHAHSGGGDEYMRLIVYHSFLQLFQDVKNALSIAHLPDIPGRSGSSLHQARIQFKRFRYSIEVIDALYPVDDQVKEKALTFQKMLGEIQDISVLLEMLFQFITKHRVKHPDLEFFEFLTSIENKYISNVSLFFNKRNEIPRIQESSLIKAIH